LAESESPPTASAALCRAPANSTSPRRRREPT